MKISYKIYEFDQPEFLETRNRTDGGTISRNVLVESKMKYWQDYNDFNSMQEAFDYIEQHKEHFKGLELTVLPITSIGYWD